MASQFSAESKDPKLKHFLHWHSKPKNLQGALFKIHESDSESTSQNDVWFKQSEAGKQA